MGAGADRTIARLVPGTLRRSGPGGESRARAPRARPARSGVLTMAQLVPRLRARAERLKRHPNLLVRRLAQMVILMCLVVRLVPWAQRTSAKANTFESSELIDNPSFSLGVRDYLQSPGVLRPTLGRVARLLIALEAADARLRDLA